MLIIVTHHPNAYMHPFDVPSLWTYQGMIGILTVGRIFNVKDFAEAQLEDCCGWGCLRACSARNGLAFFCSEIGDAPMHGHQTNGHHDSSPLKFWVSYFRTKPYSMQIGMNSIHRATGLPIEGHVSIAEIIQSFCDLLDVFNCSSGVSPKRVCQSVRELYSRFAFCLSLLRPRRNSGLLQGDSGRPATVTIWQARDGSLQCVPPTSIVPTISTSSQNT